MNDISRSLNLRMARVRFEVACLAAHLAAERRRENHALEFCSTVSRSSSRHAELYGGSGSIPTLQDWVLSHVRHWQSVYREAIRLGWPSDFIVTATLASDSTDGPPVRFTPILRVSRGMLTSRVPGFQGLFDLPAGSGSFYALATKRAGRQRDSFVCSLPIPTPEQALPRPGLISPSVTKIFS
jgi:hypothetical protein